MVRELYLLQWHIELCLTQRHFSINTFGLWLVLLSPFCYFPRTCLFGQKIPLLLLPFSPWLHANIPFARTGEKGGLLICTVSLHVLWILPKLYYLGYFIFPGISGASVEFLASLFLLRKEKAMYRKVWYNVMIYNCLSLKWHHRRCFSVSWSCPSFKLKNLPVKMKHTSVWFGFWYRRRNNFLII